MGYLQIIKLIEILVSLIPSIVNKFNELKDDDGKIDVIDLVKLCLFIIEGIFNKLK